MANPQTVFYKARPDHDILNGVAVINLGCTVPSGMVDPSTFVRLFNDTGRYQDYASGDSLLLFQNLSDRFQVRPSGWSH